ncbi:MAG: metallophosphoesterase family protein [Clostridia bacterium]|nr:metallophosphoesterase family protein [Clostridia bacterium]
MAIAVFGDIHGNLEALEAILKDIKRNRKITDVYYLGDAIVFGPDSAACLRLLRKHNVKCVLGNHEQRITKYDESATAQTYANKELIETTFATLDREDLAFIAQMPLEIKINYKGAKILFTHYCHDENDKVLDTQIEFTEKELHKYFKNKKCDVIFFGHLHKRKILIDEEKHSYILQGSSGCVKGDKTFYTLFDIIDNYGVDDNFNIYRVDVKYNRKKFVNKMQTANLPGKEVFAPFCFGISFDNAEKKENA